MIEKFNFDKLRRDYEFKGCFHKDKNCSSKIINAHSVQKNRILNAIAEKSHVLSFRYNLLNMEKDMQLKEIGKRLATVFSGFCEYHDNLLFIPIERKNYNIGNKEQEFIFAYRALAYEYHAKMSVKQMFENLLKWTMNKDIEKLSKYLYNGSNEIDEEIIQNQILILKIKVIGYNADIQQLERMRIAFNNNLDKHNYYKIETQILEFPEEYHLAVSSMFAIHTDFDNNILNDITELKTTLKHTFLTIFPQNGKTYVLISYEKKYRKYFRFINNQIINKSIDEQKIILSNIIALYVENFAISPKKWRELNEEIKNKFYNIFYSTMFSEEINMSKQRDINLFI